MEKIVRKKRMPKSLKEQRRELIYYCRYKQNMTLEGIGSMFDISKERVRQILNERNKKTIKNED